MILTHPGEYNPDPNWLAVANLFYPAQEMVVSLTIPVIDTSSTRLPAELADKSFDDPEAVKGYERYYGVGNKAFASYLGTLGLRTYEGKNKDAFRALVEEEGKRGWRWKGQHNVIEAG